MSKHKPQLFKLHLISESEGTLKNIKGITLVSTYVLLIYATISASRFWAKKCLVRF